jgi:hypothetical protein
MPAMKMKSPARVPRLHVPVGLMAPGGDNVFTPFGDTGCPNAENVDRTEIANMAATSLRI